MKIKVFGKAHISGVSKKTGNPYDSTVIHTLMPVRGVEGEAAQTIWLNASDHPVDSIQIGSTYEVEFNNTGYPVTFKRV